jgi:hypothetical protein
MCSRRILLLFLIALPLASSDGPTTPQGIFFIHPFEMLYFKLLLKKFLVLVVDASEPPPSVNHGGHHDTNQTGHHHSGIHVFIADFSRVQIPFIISAWILSASIAKIGNILFHINKMLPVALYIL